MRQFFILLILFGLLGPAAGQKLPPVEPGRLLLKLRPTQPAAVQLGVLAPALRALEAGKPTQKFAHTVAPDPERPGSVDLSLIYEVPVPVGLPVAKARAALLATGAVEYVEPPYRRAPLYQPNDPLADSAAAVTQYHLKLTRAYRAWDFTRGDTSVVIGLTDTGMRITHEDLVRQLKYNYADPINGVDDDGDGYVDNFRGWDLSNGNNDPLPEATTVHGSQVAGIAVGQADNGKGGAGTGFLCKYLPVQVFSDLATGSFAGYEAIVYAADHGCRVINMSWGGEGYPSSYEQDVCTYAAVNRDVVLVAAAGNSGTNTKFYPASYDHVLSVAATDAADAKASFGTYNYRVDVSAPGVGIRSVYGRNTPSAAGQPDADYWIGSGSSFASPQVAAAAGLVRARFPQLTAEQVQAQLRRSADTTLYAVAANAAYAGQLGRGRLNVARAVAAFSQREARVVASTFAPARPAGYLPGDTLQLTSTVRNLLLPLTGLSVTLTSLSPYLSVRRGGFAVGSLPTLGTASNAGVPFRLTVAAGPVPPNTVATLRYHLAAAGGYQADQYVEVLLNPDFNQLDAGDLYLSVTGRGNLGYDNAQGTGGRGLGYRQDAQLLAEGGLLLAVSPTRVSDRLRTSGGASRQSFYELGALVRLVPGPRADQQLTSTFRDSLPDAQRPRSVGVRVRQRGQSWAAPAGLRNVVLLDYVLRNLTADTLKPLYAGLFADWDLPGASSRNLARYDSTRRVGYCYDPLATRVFTGVQVLSAQPAGAYSIDNNAAAGSAIYLADGFSPAEKYLALSGGTTRATWSAGPADVSQVVSARVARLAPGDSVTVAFALLAAPTLAGLQAAAATAQATYQQQVLAVAAPPAPAAWQVYPTPATDQLRVVSPPDFGTGTVELLDELGRVVGRWGLPAGGGDVPLRNLPAGLYLLRAAGPGGLHTCRVVKAP